MAGNVFDFEHLSNADLIVDAVYRSKRVGNAILDPLCPLLEVSSQGGFRYRGDAYKAKYSLVAIYSSGLDLDWPDELDLENGSYIYYGDNKSAGTSLLETRKKGNLLLQHIFEYARGDAEARAKVPPVFIFTKGASKKDVIFRGLAVPGSPNISPLEELTAVWKSSPKGRFQNYRAYFSILNIARISREWIEDLKKGDILSRNCPAVWRNWVKNRTYQRLIAPKTISIRNKQEQLPQNTNEEYVVNALYNRFKDNPFGFEKAAAELVKLMDQNVLIVDLTRPWADGGRDALGKYRIGTLGSFIHVEFAMEAKCYFRNNAVGVKETSRLISRLKYRQFGILVTTSYVHHQAYQEIKSDLHPVIILSGSDIAKILISHGYGSSETLPKWLDSFVEVNSEMKQTTHKNVKITKINSQTIVQQF